MADDARAPGPTEEKLRDLAAYSGDPWNPENEYFAMAEPHMKELWETLIHPFIQDCDFDTTLDLAAGQGRNSVFLLGHAKQLAIMDIQAGNIAACRARFAARDDVSYHVNNGYDLRPLADSSLTLVYCFDAMVHFEGEVVAAYLLDTRRVLRPGGRGFFHHSNYQGGRDWRTNPAARNFMSSAIFAGYATDAGLRVVRQQVINWGGYVDHDCLTLVERPA